MACKQALRNTQAGLATTVAPTRVWTQCQAKLIPATTMHTQSEDVSGLGGGSNKRINKCKSDTTMLPSAISDFASPACAADSGKAAAPQWTQSANRSTSGIGCSMAPTERQLGRQHLQVAENAVLATGSAFASLCSSQRNLLHQCTSQLHTASGKFQLDQLPRAWHTR